MNSSNPISYRKYNNGLFARIPPVDRGTAVILVDGVLPAVIVDAFLTTSAIRRGKYTQLVVVNLSTYQIEVLLTVKSRDTFDLNVKITVNVRVSDAIKLYDSKITNLISALSGIFGVTVRQVAREYDAEEYVNIGDFIRSKLPSNEVVDPSIGIAYTVLDADVTLGDEAFKYIREIADNRMRARVERERASHAEQLSEIDVTSAILGEVTAGKINMTEALEKIRESKRRSLDNGLSDLSKVVDFINKMRADGHFTNEQAANYAESALQSNNILKGLPENFKQSDKSDNTNDNDNTIDDLY